MARVFGTEFLRKLRLGFASTALAFTAAAAAGGPALSVEEPLNTAIDRLDQPALTLAIPAEAELQTIEVSADGRLIAVGQRGVTVFSDDDGETWTQAPSPVAVALTAIAPRGDGLLLAVGHDGVILRSADNGSSWERVTDGRDLFPGMIAAMQARYEAGKAAFDALPPEEKTDDAAFALEDLDFRVDTMNQSMEFGPAWPFLDVFFLSNRPTERRALAIGAFGMAFLSEDEGRSWTLVNDRFDNETDFHLNAGYVTDAGTILIGSEAGMMFRSDASARSFEFIETFDGFSFFNLAKIPGTSQIAAYGFGDTYHVSFDDGASWSSKPLSESLTLAGNVLLPTGGLGVMGDGGQMFELGPDGEKRRFRPLDTRRFLGDAVALDGGKVLFVGEIGVRTTENP